MAKTKSKGVTGLGRDSVSKRLGVKLHNGEAAKPGNIIIRQRGTKFIAGKNVKRGSDDALYSLKEGRVKFRKVSKTRFDGKKRVVSMVIVEPVE